MGGETVAGGKLKETGTIHWDGTNTGATNETGFTALPGGYRALSGSYNYIGDDGMWWSSIGSLWETSTSSYFKKTGGGRKKSGSDYNFLNTGFSVRCLRD